ncbi:MAG: lytic transglycosylase [Acidobacteria bacterium]|nr:MAG: lytic transglycosylase [Acidobacteriota bacterium]
MRECKPLLGSKPAIFLAAAITLSACGPGARRGAISVQPPAAAWAPEPLPLRTPQLPPLPPRAATGPADELIGQAESQYKTGLADYRAGNLEKARQEFDRALGILLESKLDVETDEQLSAEFDKLVDDIHGVELAAIERGDTLSEHKYEAPPIESFAGLTFPVDPKVKQQVQQEIKSVRSDLPLISNDLVDGFITLFQKHARHFMQTVLERRPIYEQMISEELRKEGLPQDLIYLAAGESAFNPFALSHAGAKGIWQFMLGTGSLYGLKRNRWVDEREDPAKSTHAAARHLKELYQTFGDWYLAMAAYDSGPVTVQRAIERTGYADFWTLRKLHALPLETENYVPIFIATALIAKDPKAYGFEVPANQPLATEQATVAAPTDLRLVAQLIDRPVEDLIRLNPSLQRWTTPANDRSFVLNLPGGTKETFERAIAAIPPDKRIWWRAHKVEQGETLAAIARKYRISTVALAQANRMDAGATPAEGARVVLPLASGDEGSLARVRERGPRRLYQYRVRPGDTIELVADRFDVAAYQIRRWNNLRSARLTPGKTLKVYSAGRGGASSRSRRATQHGATAHRAKSTAARTRRRSGTETRPIEATRGPVAAR